TPTLCRNGLPLTKGRVRYSNDRSLPSRRKPLTFMPPLGRNGGIFMETLAVRPLNEQVESQSEQLRSFDPLASVKMMRFDLECFWYVLPETRQRACDEELSYLA